MTFSLLSDSEIRRLCKEEAMIYPFMDNLVRENYGVKSISYGLSSYGYDLRLSPADFRVFKHQPGQIIDPKNFSPDFLEKQQCRIKENGEAYFILPGNSYALCVAAEYIMMPKDVAAICLVKSTYARCGILPATTVIEPGWKGSLTLEISNSSSADAMIYANEGIAQLLFFRGDPCEISYACRSGKYQGQLLGQVTLPTV